mmetsp:Transcript_35034/g.25497  ORF Transcript_35034/g.25497 Transcript_35034/m.25497 type:complete len:87 (-) Transcript_35034:553-813(-)
MSCVRSNDFKHSRASLGFFTDWRRLNVAITRAKHYLFIVGNAKTLKKDNCWEQLINMCEKGKDDGFYHQLTTNNCNLEYLDNLLFD